MNVPDRKSYLSDIVDAFKEQWPGNRTINVVCHGHSVPAGYFATPLVDTFNAYPHLLHIGLKHRFPFAVINVIVTAIGGEHSATGAARFSADVLCHRPDLIIIDYGLGDREIGLEKAHAAWSRMIRAGRDAGAKIILLTPTANITMAEDYQGKDKTILEDHAVQIRRLAAESGVGLADCFRVCQDYLKTGDLSDILSWPNHPNRKGHELVAKELLRWFPVA